MKTIIEMAQDAGFWREHINTWMCRSEDIERFAELVRAEAQAEEREECAKVCENIYEGDEACGDWPSPEQCAEAIRSRENT